MSEKKQNPIFAVLLCAVLIVGFGAFALFYKGPVKLDTDTTQKSFQAPQESSVPAGSGNERWYRQNDPALSFRIPDGFSTPNAELPNGGTELAVTDPKGENVVLIVTVRLAPNSSQELTEEIIRSQNSGDSVSDITPASLPDGTQGLAFRTNSKNWEGNGIAFWFVEGGYLFELSTAAKNQPLLEEVVQTMSFPAPK